MPVEPLVCYWVAMHPTGSTEPFFEVALNGSVFRRVSVFSMSAYLRSLRDDDVVLEMPDAAVRMSWLTKLFPV